MPDLNTSRVGGIAKGWHPESHLRYCFSMWAFTTTLTIRRSITAKMKPSDDDAISTITIQPMTLIINSRPFYH